MPTALAVSPHLDDAAFSCGGTLARLAAAGWRVVVATAFTRSVARPTGFALACQTDKGLGPDVDYMAVRRVEDGAALAALRAEPVWLDLAEAPHRGYGSAAELFGPLGTDDEAGPDVLRLVAAQVEALEPDLILAPQAIGGHVDHVQVVRALEALSPRQPVLWWRDFPYVSRDAEPAEPFRVMMEGRAEIGVVLDGAASAAKREACRAYGTQLGFQFGGQAGLDAALARAGARETFRLTGTLPDDIASSPGSWS